MTKRKNYDGRLGKWNKRYLKVIPHSLTQGRRANKGQAQERNVW